MGEAIAVVSGKGGAGKTSIVAGLSTCLAAMGYTVLAVDADVGLRNLDIVLGMSDKTALDFGDILAGRVPFDKAIVAHDIIEDLYLLNAPNTLPDDSDDCRFADIIRQAKDKYRFCFIDCAAGLGRTMRMAAGPADRAIVVTTPDSTSLRDAARTVGILESFGITEIGLVVNRVRVRLVEKAEAPNIDDAMDTAGIPLLGIVPEDERVITSANHEKPIIMRASDGAALAYYNIARRLLGQQIPLMKI
jgi:septum site-determining protein MinD